MSLLNVIQFASLVTVKCQDVKYSSTGRNQLQKLGRQKHFSEVNKIDIKD